MKSKLTLRALPVVLTTLAAASICHTAPARADDYSPANNPNTLRVGMYFIFYHVKAGDITGPYTPAVSVFRLLSTWLMLYDAFTLHRVPN